MKLHSLFTIIIISSIIFSCKSEQKPDAPASKEEILKSSINSLEQSATNGDLILRLGNDLLSYQIKLLNDSSKLYSHAGIIVEKNGKKWVAHLAPDAPGADTIQYVSIDSFVNPAHNITCALYRYKLSPEEKDSVAQLINAFKTADIRFDRFYDLSTDDKMYCSEMISKALQKATNKRIAAESIYVKKNMLKIVTAYFKKEKNAEKVIPQRKYIPLDLLYRNPECSLVMQLNLQTNP